MGEHGQEVVSGKERARVEVWDVDAHYRPVLVQSTGAIRLGPIPAGGRECRAVFGLTMQAEAGPIPVLLGVEREPGRAEPVFETELRSEQGRAWREYEVEIAAGSAEPFWILLTVGAASGQAAPVGWSAPHVICRVSRPSTPRPTDPHIVLISLDTLRADHLGVYGYERNTSPVIDALADESIVFDNAFSPSNWTLPSHASLLTGFPPSVHRAGHDSAHAPLPPDGVPTVAERLRDAGYWTIAFTAGGMMSRRNGLDRGFQWWTERTRGNLASTLPGVFDAIGVAPVKPLFLVLHTYDIHGPYAYLPGAGEIRVESRSRGESGRPHGSCLAPTACNDAAEWQRVRSIPYHDYQRFERFDDLADAIDAYDVGIRFVDTHLGRLVARLRDLGIFDDTLLIITSDHGEALYDRALYLGHSYTLHDEEVRVPLVVRSPGGQKGRSSALTTLADVAALVLEEAGVSLASDMEGRNPLTRREARGFVAGESTHTGQTYLRTEQWKLVSPVAPGVKNLVPSALADRFDVGAQIYSYADDPFEQRNRVAHPPSGSALTALRAELGALPAPGAHNALPAPALDAQQQQQLRELGYLR